MKTYRKVLFLRVLFTVFLSFVVAWTSHFLKFGFEMTGMMTRSVVLLAIFSAFGIFIYLGEQADFKSAAKRHEVPLAWIIEGIYTKKMEYTEVVFGDNFKETYLSFNGGQE